MSIFSNWGKGKNTDTDPQETAEKAEKAKQEIEAERQAFLDRIKVENTDRPKSVESTSDNNSDDPDVPDKGERTRDEENIRDDDDGVR